MALIIRVSRDGNFDTAYEWAQRFLELHPRNDDRAQLLKQRDRSPKPTGPPPYAWTAKEMSAVERMARLEPCEDDDDPWDLLRRAYNDSVFGEIQRDASESASDLLRKIFQAEN